MLTQYPCRGVPRADLGLPRPWRHHEEQARALTGFHLTYEPLDASTDVLMHPAGGVLGPKTLDEGEQLASAELSSGNLGERVVVRTKVVAWRIVGEGESLLYCCLEGWVGGSGLGSGRLRWRIMLCSHLRCGALSHSSYFLRCLTFFPCKDTFRLLFLGLLSLQIRNGEGLTHRQPPPRRPPWPVPRQSRTARRQRAVGTCSGGPWSCSRSRVSVSPARSSPSSWPPCPLR